ncbi:CPBP family intramembrane glutamic endopeptidase [Streptococcus dentiloxodontae]
MEKNKNPYLIVTGLMLLILCINAFCHFVLEGLVGNVWRTAIQDTLLVCTFYFLNKRYLKVTTSLYSKEISFKQQFSAAWLCVFIIVSCLAGVFLDFRADRLLTALTIGLFAGIVEEYVLRGIVLGYLMQRQSLTVGRIRIALIVSSFFFGLLHLLNISSQPLVGTLIQILNTANFGLFAGAVYLRTKSLIWVMAEHIIYDLAITMAGGMESSSALGLIGITVWAQLALAVPLAIFILRPKKLSEIYDLSSYKA